MEKERAALSRGELFRNGLESSSTRPPLGWVCTYTPEELLLAAGFTPVRLPCSSSHPSLETPLPANLCGYVRGLLGTALGGLGPDLVGVVFAMSCDAMRRLADAWSFCFPNHFVYRLDVPRRWDPDAEEFFYQQLSRLREALGVFGGHAISDADLEAAIALVNETRRLLQAISFMRFKATAPVTGAQVLEITQKAQEMDKERFNEEARRFLELHRNGSSFSCKANRFPVVLGGGTLAGACELAAIAEECGLFLAAAHVCTGSRAYEGLVESDSEPLRALARRYLKRPGCARMQGAASRVRRLMDLAKGCGAVGVVFQSLKFCDPVQSDLPWLRRACREHNLPLLQLERDGSVTDSGQLKTRLQAFAELLAARPEEQRS
ncbi:MAG: 2-hydroxyacyl-CoA dehydratase family protein [Desulfosoma sp.]